MDEGTNPFHAALGVYYMKLKYLVDDYRDSITEGQPLELRLMWRKGLLGLRVSVGPLAVAWIDLSLQPLEQARAYAEQSLRFLTDQLGHVTYQDMTT